MTQSNQEMVSEPSSQLAVLIAPSFRRIVANEEFKKGVRTIWHRGRINTDMLTWENQNGTIEQQELTFAYLVVEFSHKKGLRTGKIPYDMDLETTSGHAKSEMVEYDANPELEVLQNAHSLLAHCPQRDRYGQHLMEHIASKLTSGGAPPPPATFEIADDDANRETTPDSKGSKTGRSSPIPLWGWVLLGVSLLMAYWLL